jgi:hypothetical protein
LSNRARVTITLPADLVEEIDRRERNRSRFVVEAVEREIDRRRRAELRRSLENPHPESEELAGGDLEEWARTLPDDSASDLVDLAEGRAVRWVQGEGWIEADD